MRNPFTPAPEPSAVDEVCGSLKLTRKQRLYGFGICFVAGFLLSILSSLCLATGNIAGFAVMYTFGNVVSLLSTGFLSGPWNQFKQMFDATRRIASVTFLLTMILTLVLAFTIKSVILIILLCIIQFFALFWYSASYIPFARDMIKRCFGSTTGISV